MYFGYKQSEVWVGALNGAAETISGMDGSYTDNSVNVDCDQIAGTQNNNHSDNSGNSDNSDNSDNRQPRTGSCRVGIR